MIKNLDKYTEYFLETDNRQPIKAEINYMKMWIKYLNKKMLKRGLEPYEMESYLPEWYAILNKIELKLKELESK